MEASPLIRLGRAALPIVAVLVFVTFVGSTVAVAGDTLGFDFLAYHQAAVRLLDGEPLYDMSFAGTGGFGLFYYPPTFAPMILLFGVLSATTAVWLWTGVLIGSFVLGTAILPVSRTIRWWVVLLAGLSWPFAYAVKLGQVGPLLYLLFAVGWRWLDEPIRLGVSMALGTAIKLQPAILFVWALLTRRFKAVSVGATLLVWPGACGHPDRGCGHLVRFPDACPAGRRPDHDTAQLHARRHRLSGRRSGRRRGTHPAGLDGRRPRRGRRVRAVRDG